MKGNAIKKKKYGRQTVLRCSLGLSNKMQESDETKCVQVYGLRQIARIRQIIHPFFFLYSNLKSSLYNLLSRAVLLILILPVTD